MNFINEKITCLNVLNKNGVHYAITVKVDSLRDNSSHTETMEISYFVREYERRLQYDSEYNLEKSLILTNFTVLLKDKTIRVKGKVKVIELPKVDIKYCFIDIDNRMSVDKLNSVLLEKYPQNQIEDSNILDGVHYKRSFDAQTSKKYLKEQLKTDVTNSYFIRNRITSDNYLEAYNSMLEEYIKTGTSTPRYVIKGEKYSKNEYFCQLQDLYKQLEQIDDKLKTVREKNTLKTQEGKFKICPVCESRINISHYLKRHYTESTICPICETGDLQRKGATKLINEIDQERRLCQEKIADIKNKMGIDYYTDVKKIANKQFGWLVCVATISIQK